MPTPADPQGNLPRRRLPAFNSVRFESETRDDIQQTKLADWDAWVQPQVQPITRRQQIEQIQESGGPGFGDIPVLGGLATGTGSFVTGVLDALDRPRRAQAGALIGGQQDNKLGIRDWQEGFWTGLTSPAEETLDYNMATWLENVGFVPEHEWARNVFGFGLDFAEPTALLGFGPVRRAIGAGTRGIGQAAARIPTPGVSARNVGEVAEAVESSVGPPIARRLSTQVLGTDMSHWQLRRLARLGPERGGITEEAAVRIQGLNRAIRQMKFGGEHQAVRHITGELREQGVSEDAVQRLVRDEEHQREVARILIDARQKNLDYSQAPPELEKLGLLGLWRYIQDDFVSNLPKLQAQANRTGRPIQWDDLNVAGAFEKHLLPNEPSEALKATLHGEGFYWRYLMPDWGRLTSAMETDPALRGRPFTGKRVARTEDSRALTADDLIEQGIDTNVVRVLALDRADTLLKARIAEFLGEDLLMQLGVRKIDPNQINLARSRMRKAGVSAHPVLQIAEQFSNGLVDHAPARRQMVEALAGLEDEAGGTADLLLDNIKRPGEASYRMNDAVTYLREIETATGGQVADLTDDATTEMAGFLRQLRESGDDLDVLLPTDAAKQSATELRRIRHEATQLTGPEEIIRMYSTLRNPLKMGGMVKLLDYMNGFWTPFVTIFPLNSVYFTRNGAGHGFLLHMRARMPLGEIVSGYPRALRHILDPDLAMEIPIDDAARAIRNQKGLPTPENGIVRIPGHRFFEAMENRAALGTRYRDEAVIDPLQTSAGRLERGAHSALRAFGNRQYDAARSTRDRFNQALLDYDQQMNRRAHAALGGLLPSPRPRGQYGFLGFKLGATVAESQDNVAKVLLMRWRLSKGDSFDEAADAVRHALFAYEDAPPAVRAATSVFPFSKWLWFSGLANVHNLIYNPDKVADLAIASRQRSSGVPEDVEADAITTPDWILERHHVMLGHDPDGNMEVLYAAGVPFEDLNRAWAGGFGNTLENVLADVTPWLRVPFELGADHAVFTGEPISDPSYSNLFTRAWVWSDQLPGLRDWLQITRTETPGGRIEYRSANPIPMYVISSLIGRPVRSVDNVNRIIEQYATGNRAELGQTVTGLLSGAKITRIYPDLPSDVDLGESLAQNPALASLYNTYRNIPLYPQLGSAADSRRGYTALGKLQSMMRMLRSLDPEMDEDTRWKIAGDRYRQVDEAGWELADQIRTQEIRQAGRQLRRQFLDANPALRGAIEELTTHDQRYLLDRAVEEAGVIELQAA